MVKQIAGAPFASGGYGCVFRPPLKCNNESVQSRLEVSDYSYVTKLMLKAEGKKEIKLNATILDRIKIIPQFKKYFLLSDIFECNDMFQLDENDLTNYNTICDSLSKDYKVVVSRIRKTIIGIKPTNINSRLDELIGIYMPDGGVEISNISYRLPSTVKHMNLKFINVLIDAIIPMNKIGIYHCDIKSSNLLLKGDPEKDTSLKIIDWGLASIINHNEPLNISGIPFMSNNVFSIILLDGLPKIKRLSTIRNLLNDLIRTCRSHSDDFYQGILYNLHNCGHVDPTESYIKYLEKTVHGFLIPDMTTGSLKFDVAKHLEIVKHNADIWGLLSCYNRIIRQQTNDLIKDKLIFILNKYCYSGTFACKKIPINDLISDMSLVNTLCVMTRCPNGYRKNKDRVCEPKSTTIKLRRCPNGSRRNKITKKCEIK